MKKRFLSMLLVLVMVIGMIPFSALTASAAGGDGLTEATAKVVTNYAEFESAMEDSSIVYVKIDSNIDSAIQKSGSGIDVGAMVAGKKVLIVNATAEFYGYMGAQAIDSLLYVQDGDDLTIKGDGTLKFVPNANATFNSVVRIDGGTVTVSGNVTIEGYTGATTYANAITNTGGNLNLLKGTYKGTLRIDGENTNNFAVVDLRGGNTVVDNITASATVSNEGLNESKASAMRMTTGVNSVVIQGGTFEKVNNYSIVVDSSKVIANYVYSGIKMYDASTHTEVSDYDEIYTIAKNVYFANAPKNSITSLTLGTNKIVSGTKVSDLALTTYDTDKCILGTYFVMNGLNKGLGDTSNAFLSTDTLNPQTDCSAIYTINAKSGITFASDFSAEDITFTNGIVTNVGNYGNAINVFVNFPKQTSEEPDESVITSLTLGTNKIVSGTKVSDLALTTYDTDKCTLGTYFVMNGLNKGLGDTGNAFLSTDPLNPQVDCSAIYTINAKSGMTFAPDFSAEDITFTNGIVTNVGNYGNAINVFVNFPKQEPQAPEEFKVNSIELQVAKPVIGEAPTKPTIKSVNGDESLKDLVSFFNDAKVYWVETDSAEDIANGNKNPTVFADGKIYALHVAIKTTKEFAEDCVLKVYGTDGELLWSGNLSFSVPSDKTLVYTDAYLGNFKLEIGNVNGDDLIDFTDLQRLYQHITGDNPLSGDALGAADVNADTVIDFSDLQALFALLSQNA